MIGTLNQPAHALSRRGVIVGLGAVGVAGMGLAISHHLTASRPLANGALYKIVYDDREAEGRAFGARFAAAGYATATVGDDPTWLWFDDLHHRWRGAGVAGLTTPAVALSLKMMAELIGLRAVIWGRHLVGPSSRTSHVVAAPERVLAAWKRQADAGMAWTGALHDMILAAAAQPAAARFTHISGVHEGGTREMVSWLLAPVSKGSA